MEAGTMKTLMYSLYEKKQTITKMGLFASFFSIQLANMLQGGG